MVDCDEHSAHPSGGLYFLADESLGFHEREQGEIMSENAMFKVGEIVVLETGEYSDRGWHGPFRVLKDFDMREAVAQCVAEHKPAHEWDKQPSPYDLAPWLQKSGFIEDIPCRTLHVGSYGEISLEL